MLTRTPLVARISRAHARAHLWAKLPDRSISVENKDTVPRTMVYTVMTGIR